MNVQVDKNSTVVVLDENGHILYCNGEVNRIRSLIKKLYERKFCVDDDIKKESNLFNITTEKFYVNDVMCWIVCIEFQSPLAVYVDYATGLFNRNYWERIKSSTFNELYRNFTLVIVDIDDLKFLNDTYGHIEGDKAIRIVGKSIKDVLKEEDIGIHYGGDEFIIILTDKTYDMTMKTVNKIRYRIKEQCAGLNYNLKISVGIASSDYSKTLEQTLDLADRNMYYEKRSKNIKNKLKYLDC